MLTAQPWFPTRWPLWAWLAFLAIVFALRFPVHFILEPPYLMDFEVYRAVAERVVHGLGREVYAPTTSSVMVLKYAPCWALFLSPLAWVPAFPGAIAWSCLTVGWLIAGCALAMRLIRSAELRSPAWIPAVAVIVLVRPLTGEFLNGQIDLLWSLLVIGFLVADQARRPWWSAVCLALAISLRLPALVFLGYLAVRGRWDSVLRTAGLCLALNLISAAILVPAQPLEPLRQWVGVLLSSGPDRAFEIGNQNLLSLMGRLLSYDGYHLNIAVLPPAFIWLAYGAAVAALFALVAAGRKHPVIDGALLTILMVIGSPTVWVATYSALLLPVMLALALAWQRARQRALDVMLLALLGLGSLMTHSSFWRAVGLPSFRGESYVFLVLMVLPWFALALFAYLWLRRRQVISP